MSSVRLLCAADIPAVADLRARVFTRARLSGAALEAHFERIFLRNPWYREGEGALVHVAASGAVNGFLGLMPRPFRRGNRELNGMTSAQLMVAPEARAMAGIRLLRAAFERPVDLLLTDTATAEATQLWELLGGAAALVYGTQWTIPLRRAEYRAQHWGSSLPARVARRLGRPLMRALDELTPRAADEPRSTPGSASEIAAHADELAGDRLHARYDTASLEFLLAVLRQRWGDGVHIGMVRNDVQLQGWFVCGSEPYRPAWLYQMYARRGAEQPVLSAAVAHAREHGALVLNGRFDRALMPAVARLGGSTAYHGRGVLVHTRDAALLQHILSGNALVSGFEGEWWMGFGE